MTSRRRGDRSRFWSVVGAIVAADVASKAVAVATLAPIGLERPVLGDWLRWKLVYNPGAAFGLHLGAWSRPAFILLSLVALGILWRVYAGARAGDRARVLAVALVGGGAIGNLLDRLRASQGVVDFIDVGIGSSRWPTFNVADIAVSCGAILLAWVLWTEEEAASEPAGAPAGGRAEPAADVVHTP